MVGPIMVGIHDSAPNCAMVSRLCSVSIYAHDETRDAHQWQRLVAHHEALVRQLLHPVARPKSLLEKTPGKPGNGAGFGNGGAGGLGRNAG